LSGRRGEGNGVPLAFNQHYTGTMDHRDPAVTDGFAKDREVILFNNAGISSSSGDVPTSVEEMAANAAAFIKALDPTQVDVLGFSLGSSRRSSRSPSLSLSAGLCWSAPGRAAARAWRPAHRRVKRCSELPTPHATKN
jgi:pimeloyl-ACP methyl ester carboxylesterase